MLINLKKLNRKGDTIVEVMIVLAVLGLAIGISYATANRSIGNVRQAQENSEATTIIQSQVEGIRALASNPSSSPNNIFIAQPFCIENGSVQPLNGSDPTNFGTTTFPSKSLCAGVGTGNRYYVTISYSGAATSTFTIETAWLDTLGQGTDTATLFYRLYP
jgi:type II secretory pathway pseudopilin PulG